MKFRNLLIQRLPALASRDFAIFWAGHLLSLIGSSMQNTAQPLLAYRISGRPMSILEGLPRTVSADAAEDTELIEVNGMTFDKMIKGNIEIAIRMLRKLSIRLREADRKIEALQHSEGRLPSTARPAPAAKPKPVAPAGSGPRLEAEGEAATFQLAGDDTLVGRFDPVTELKPDVDLTQVDLKRSVSRRHARILHTADGWAVTEEVGALNGTMINGVKLVTGRPSPLQDGDKVSFGMVRLVFRAS